MKNKNESEVENRKAYVKRFILNSVRVFFAPLRGAYKEVREELRRVDREVKKK